MTEHLSADEAAERIQPTDKLGMGLAMSQPPDLLTAMGRRTDWVDLRIYAGFLTVLTELYSHPNVHNLSVFFVQYKTIADRDTKRAAREKQNIDAQALTPGAVPPLQAKFPPRSYRRRRSPRYPGPRGRA